MYSAFSINGSLIVNGDDGGGPVNDTFLLRKSPAIRALSRCSSTVRRRYAGLLDGIAPGGIQFNGLAGNDTLTVDFSNGNPIPVGGLDFDGGTGLNGMTLQGGVETSDTYSPGLNPGVGHSFPDRGRHPGQCGFQGDPFREPFAGPGYRARSAGRQRTPADNAINYTRARSPNGLVTIDNFESIEFSNKSTLTINGLAGSDEVNLNNSSTPTGLTGITVNGGDPPPATRSFSTASWIFRHAYFARRRHGEGQIHDG